MPEKGIGLKLEEMTEIAMKPEHRISIMASPAPEKLITAEFPPAETLSPNT